MDKSVKPIPDGTIMHAEIRVGDSAIMIADVEAAFARAANAGAKVLMPLVEKFWGDRAGQLEDPFGYRWMLAQRVKDLTPQEMKAAHEAFTAGTAAPR